MSPALEMVVDNALPEIRRLSAAVEAFCAREEIAPRVAFNLTMALDELLTNTISYGYEAGERQTIAVTLTLEADSLTTEIRDAARPFNPLEDAPAPNLDLDLEDRQIGGLGVHLVKSLVDAGSYRHEDGLNIVTLTQRLAPASGQPPMRGQEKG